MQKNTFILEVLTILKYLIPVIFFLFTHYIDEKIHKVWRFANYHPAKIVRLINRYQWEVCFLVISLLAILGIEIAHKPEPNYYDIGIYVFMTACLLIAFLFFKTIGILHNENQVMSPFIFYISIFLYGGYIATAVYFEHQSDDVLFAIWTYEVARWNIFTISFILSVAFFIVIRKYIHSLKEPGPLANIGHNISLYKNKKTKTVKRQEALFYIINYYFENKNGSQIKKWLKAGEKEFPRKTQSIREVFGL